MSEKTAVLTFRTDDATREWVTSLARKSGYSLSSLLDMAVAGYIDRVKCCVQGPHSCDHVWCDICGAWSTDNGGMDWDTGEAYYSCGHFLGISRCSDEDIPADKLHRNPPVDPAQVKTLRQFIGDVR